MEVRAGNPSVLHHVIVYGGADPGADNAASRLLLRQHSRRARRPPEPLPLFIFKEGTQIPAGQTGGRPLPPDQRVPPGPNDRPAPARLGPTVGGFAPGQFVRVYQEDALRCGFPQVQR